MAVDAVWVGYPKSWTKGRNRPVQFVTLHYTAGSEGNTSAEAGAAYDKRREDGTSTHYFTDSEGLPVWEVPIGDRAHTARRHGNEIGVHIEICGTRQTRAQWLDAVSTRTLKTTAKLVAQLCRELGLPVRRLSTAETRAAYYAEAGKRPKGINDHNACTEAFPEDNGTHNDVGSAFPWDLFLPWVQAFYNGEEEGCSVMPLPKKGDGKANNKQDEVQTCQRILGDIDPKYADLLGDTDEKRYDGEYGAAMEATVKQFRIDRGQPAETSGAKVTPWTYKEMLKLLPDGPSEPPALVPHQHKFSVPAVVGTTGPAEPLPAKTP